MAHDFSINDIPWLRKYHVDVCINKHVLTDELISEFKKNKIKINAWTINNQDELYTLSQKGIKIITSDNAIITSDNAIWK